MIGKLTYTLNRLPIFEWRDDEDLEATEASLGTVARCSGRKEAVVSVPVWIEPPYPVNDGNRVMAFLQRVPCEGEWIDFDEDFPNEFLAGTSAAVKIVLWPIHSEEDSNTPPVVRLTR